MYNLLNSINEFINNFEDEKKINGFWKAPLLRLLPTSHPLIPELRQSVTSDHFLPEELLPSSKSILIIFIPFEDKIIESNVKGESASEDWAKAYIYTNELLGFINDELEKILISGGFQTLKIKATHNFFNEKTLLSRWSHRHLAWIAGLGTFGINNMLITEKGCCGRFGSFLTNADSKDLEIPFSTSGPSNEKCLFKKNRSCGLCHKKCFTKCYSEKGFDRHKCYSICLKNAETFKSLGLADVCGKCLVGLPCSAREPV